MALFNPLGKWQRELPANYFILLFCAFTSCFAASCILSCAECTLYIYLERECDIYFWHSTNTMHSTWRKIPSNKLFFALEILESHLNAGTISLESLRSCQAWQCSPVSSMFAIRSHCWVNEPEGQHEVIEICRDSSWRPTEHLRVCTTSHPLHFDLKLMSGQLNSLALLLLLYSREESGLFLLSLYITAAKQSRTSQGNSTLQSRTFFSTDISEDWCHHRSLYHNIGDTLKTLAW